MIQRQLKLRLTVTQEQQLEIWLFHLASVWNFAIRKIELDGQDKIYYSRMTFQNLLSGHGKKLGIPAHVLQGMLSMAWIAWQRCYKRLARKPRLKGQRNKLTSISFPDPFKAPNGKRIHVLGIGSVRFHKQDLPEGRIKCGRIIKRASGWYLCLFIDAQPNVISHASNGEVGIDPGFQTLITLSTGEKVDHPDELKQSAERLAQAQRGKRKRLTARLQERIANQRKDRNHKLSRRLVAENSLLVWSKDNHVGLQRMRFGKSVDSAGHGQLREMLRYKCTTSGREFIEVPSKFSTKTCSACGSLSGPSGYAGLSIRQWTCMACGANHDRDVNAAVNTLIAGAGIAHERRREAASEIL